ncbi:uncharacterized protein TRIVIDRAFT_221941 [Trichoderma virens Gv29-8]|uniref:Uncharacterized protein n=1 Tax=Hypocrea virens (strain Gv29-8 / FGSC 10586) TaxID=413071 RepID=G9MRE8_HYPVG|nr:uncharacterized protein TRIVIDRAFT_221941 [Trichoderma virens Gv29-8]EHK22670.1 hypothetical protein TRIVIDRAFT_221941 [Trichoderma virens Gv29-8]UKZ47725.1 hypothetical protein TrVGV298_001951 [Trichoderma virens]
MPPLIVIDSIGDEDVQFLTSRIAASENRRRATSSATLGRGSDEEVGDEEGDVEELVELFEEEVIDLTGHELENGAYGQLHEGELPIEKYRDPRSGAQFSRGDLLQVRNVDLGTYEIDFVQIQIIARDRCGHYKIRGIPFVRTRKLQGKLPKKVNEICMILHIQRRDNGEELPAVLVDVPTTSIVKRRELVITNAVYPEHCYNAAGLGLHAVNEEAQQRWAEIHGNLVCRWKFTIYFTMQRQSRATRPEEEVLERVQLDDVPASRYRVSDETLCNQWRGGRTKGGSWHPNRSGIIDLELRSYHGSTTRTASNRRTGQKYTFFDSFAGAGGVSRGAKSSGFKVQYAVDKWADV